MRIPKFLRLKNEEGAALYEYALIFPLFCTIIFAIVAMGWWWWSQSAVAVAIHDGARDAAAHDGNLTLGHDTTYRLLRAHLGTANADEYDFTLQADPLRRSVVGNIQLAHETNVPFIGEGVFEIRSRTMQRRWNFYAGPPDFWE